MRFAVRGSSRNRFWTGIEATLADSFGGFAEAVPSPNLHLSMHVGEPVAATFRVWHDAGPTTILVVRLSPALIHTAAQAMNLDIERIEIIPQMQLRDERIEHIAWALKAELESDEPHDRVYAEGLGLALAAHVLRSYSNCKAAPPAERFSKRRLARVVEYIHEHLGDNLTLAELAAVAGISPTHLKNEFKRATGMPIHQYIMHRRVDYAIRVLRARDVSLSALAQQAGFANQSHMARCMKKVAGFTPSTVRECPIVFNAVRM